MKVCSKCGIELPDNKFSKRTYPSGNTGLQNKCKDCERKIRQKYYKPHESARRKFKLSDEDYTTLIEESQGCCNVCLQPTTKLCIDHNHYTGKVRGVLCNNCNTALGLVGDNVITLSKLIRYLEQSELQE